MGMKTKIEYLKKGGSTHNFWIGGCNKISEGCKHCFTETMYKRFHGKDFSVPIKSKNFDAPLKWKKPRVILVNDMSDFFHKDVLIEWQNDAYYKIMKNAPQHIFLLLTKRPKIMSEFFRNCKILDNIWLGVSVENQNTADERIPKLLKIPYFKKWLSVEPMLGEIHIAKHLYGDNKLNWIICGGETGCGARAMCSEWAKFLKIQCECAKVPFFMKQMSNKAPIPKDLMIRQYPTEIKELII